MRRIPHIFFLVTVLLCLLCACSRGPRVIPKRKLAKIYAQMLVTDQWINATPGMNRIADTSLVYEPILQEYGYDTEDYMKTVEHYMDDPERFSRILRTTSDILEKRIKQLQKEKEELEKAVFVIKTDFKIEDYYPYIELEPYVHFYDSLTFELDSTDFYRLVPVSLSDTTYESVRMIVKSDTLSLQVDSLTVKADSLKVKTDSLQMKPDTFPMKVDSLPVKIPINPRTRRVDNHTKTMIHGY